MKFIKFGGNIVNTRYITHIYQKVDYDLNNDTPYIIGLVINDKTTLYKSFKRVDERNTDFDNLCLILQEK